MMVAIHYCDIVSMKETVNHLALLATGYIAI